MSMSQPLSLKQIDAVLTGLPQWAGDENGLTRTVQFATFGGAIRFMSACVEGIDQRDHHPVWTNTHRRLEIRLNTFDAGGKVTQRDVDLAGHLDSILVARGEQFGHVE